MNSFVTLFDSNYCSRGLVLYNSLMKNCKEDFTLYVLGMDNDVTEFLKSMNNKNMIVVSQKEIQDFYPILIKLEKERTRAEYSWTLSSFSIQYCIRKYGLESCTYIDADVCFYNDPKILLDEVGKNSILITEQNFTPKYDQVETSGKFCVQFMYFKNDKNGSEALEWWRARNEEWCFNRLEDGKIGDQMYLNDWESRFEGVYNCHNIGSGVAPWNVQKLNIKKENEKIVVEDKVSKVRGPLIFFHFHCVKKIQSNKWCLSPYYIYSDSRVLFIDYVKELSKIEKTLPEEFISKPVVFDHWNLIRKLRLFITYIKNFKKYLDEKTVAKNNIEIISISE